MLTRTLIRPLVRPLVRPLTRPGSGLKAPAGYVFLSFPSDGALVGGTDNQAVMIGPK